MRTCFDGFSVARMQNYMKKQVLEEGYKPRCYHGDRVITGGHVARFYGACLCRMANDGRSIDQIFSTREMLDDVPLIQAAMTEDALEDSTTCLHYSNNWDPKDDGVCDEILKSLARGTKPVTPLLAKTAQQRQHLNHLIKQIAYPVE